MPKNTTSLEDEEFCDVLPELGLNIDLSKVFQWIVDNYEPEDIFDFQDLQTWAKYQHITDVCDEEALMQWGHEHAKYFQYEE
jgi:hypothetical protein